MKKIFILLMLLLFLSCQKEKKAITISGYIRDSITQQPIKDAKVTILCWYDAGWDKTDYQSIDIVTSTNGFYQTTFDEGYKVAVASIAKGYTVSMKEQIRMENENFVIEINLKEKKSNLDVSDVNLRKYIVYKGTN